MGVFQGAWQGTWFPSNHATWISAWTDRMERRKNGELLFNGHRAPVCDDERILEMDRSDCCTML